VKRPDVGHHNEVPGGQPLRIVVDENIPGVEQTFARHGQIVPVPGRTLGRAVLRDANALIVRSVTRVGPALLEGSSVRFVGSATIGTDHLDLEWLEREAIAWASAPGCNADAAAQYTLAMMLLAGRRLGFELQQRRVGVVGHGNVGSRLCALLSACEVRQLAVCDPPLAAAGQTGLCGMDDIAGCDIVSLHVPLTSSGPCPTRHLLDRAYLERLPAGALVVNTARGSVIEAGALGEWLAAGRGFAALDVWPHEPEPSRELVRSATVATPHVAGYSLDGKLRGTLQVYRQFCAWLGAAAEPPDLLDSLRMETLPLSATNSRASAVLAACPVERDDAALRSLASAERARLRGEFDALRKAYPARRDFAGWHVPEEADPARSKALRDLGFR
jgi:erythronate-4-phosphate dehydrogenase